MLIKRQKEEEGDSIHSTSYWKKQTSDLLKIFIVDDSDFKIVPNGYDCLFPNNWTDLEWLNNVDLDELPVANNVKTLMIKIINKTKSDGFMNSLMYLMGFDDYPCFLYPQHEYFTNVGDEHIVAKSDFSVITKNNKMLVVMENKTMNNAKYSNNWKEDQILGELFVAVHNIASNHKNVHYPINVYAIRVVGTLFTFYRTEATQPYIKETLKKYPVSNKMKVFRHPPVEDSLHLTAYDICDQKDRVHILSYMTYIKHNLVF